MIMFHFCMAPYSKQLLIRHPAVRAMSAFTRVFDALWHASKCDGPICGRILRGSPLSRLAPQDDGQKSLRRD
jgi:hypothetical protein